MLYMDYRVFFVFFCDIYVFGFILNYQVYNIVIIGIVICFLSLKWIILVLIKVLVEVFLIINLFVFNIVGQLYELLYCGLKYVKLVRNYF